jgi:hypothetical protein
MKEKEREREHVNVRRLYYIKEEKRKAQKILGTSKTPGRPSHLAGAGSNIIYI